MCDHVCLPIVSPPPSHGELPQRSTELLPRRVGGAVEQNRLLDSAQILGGRPGTPLRLGSGGASSSRDRDERLPPAVLGLEEAPRRQDHADVLGGAGGDGIGTGSARARYI